jgi:hypothetical protein
MSEWTYALASLAELKEVISVSSEGLDPTLENILKRASEVIETFLGRHVVTRAVDLTEYHTASEHFPGLLYLRQFPTISITSVSEGSWDSGIWTASTLLTANVDYTKDSAAGTLTRLSGSGIGAWATGHERMKVVYRGGVVTADIPGDIKEICLSLAARKYALLRRGGDSSVQSLSDGLGTTTRFLPSDLLRMEQVTLMRWQRFLATGRAA